MHKARFRPDMLGQAGQKAITSCLTSANLVNPRHIKAAARTTASAASAGTMPSLTIASIAWVSISNQMENRRGFPKGGHFGAGISWNHGENLLCDTP